MLAFVSLIVLLTAVTAAPIHHETRQLHRRVPHSDMDIRDSQNEPVADEMALIFPVPVDNAKATW